ncbi:citrate/2-methylcitrate synthase [Porcipelethomonas ammoniilytica]|nr:citrate/2-methylcitrate synthase [Porcipelethomonas ammoniilytica]MBS6314934.1 citrate/2-methylcitrate synthase [Ruminococcus sp.]MCU6719742.1 citrate/2-methylcitrate synthase [Porcipelethomonas ammoniilytica]MEE0185566.1 citrate/2-methylcitrate synthase [Oscillospiraceae bacterium]OLA71106.1 MAG: citrate synthase [Ruminococcus sp. 37_24]
MDKISNYTKKRENLCIENDSISKDLFREYGVNMGLRDINGNGVLTGLTNISEVSAFKIIDGKKVPSDGQLLYRGYDVKDLVQGSKGEKFIFEEAAYLLLFGKLPSNDELKQFLDIIAECMELPTNFTRDVIMKAPSYDIMNSMTRSVLTLASYDKQAENLEISNVLRQSIQLISVFPMLAVYAYHAYNHYEKNESMYIHRPEANLSASENFLRMLRPDMKYTKLEAQVLDVALLLHMEHGGGNNSTFTTRVVTSSGSDTYSAIAAALSSLKGHKHGGANIMVMRMMDDIRNHVSDYEDEEEISAYLAKILHKEAFDRKGLIYGMGHAVYSLSDPREVIFKTFVEKLAKAKGRDKDMALYNNIEKIAPKLIAQERQIFKGVSPNVDFYSGFVYNMLDIPVELYTPLFAIARIAGWSAHRIEELVSVNKIIRPSYKSLVKKQDYVGRDDR